MRRLSSEAFVSALLRAGFAIYRRTAEATILERGGRAVTVRTCPLLDGGLLMDLRRMAGLSWRELETIVEAAPGEDEGPAASTAPRGPGPATRKPPAPAPSEGEQRAAALAG